MRLSRLIAPSAKSLSRTLDSTLPADLHSPVSAIQSPHHAFTLSEIVEEILNYCVARTNNYLPPCPKDNISGCPDICREDRSPWWWPLLVCQQWYTIGMRLHGKSACWCSDLDNIPATKGCRTLRLSMVNMATDGVQSTNHIKERTRWNLFISQLKDQYMNSGPMSVARRPQSPLRELVMDSLPSDGLLKDVLNITPLACQLTMVELKFRHRRFLDCSGMLEMLQSVRHLSISNAVLDPISDNWTLECPSRLKTLQLQNIESHYRCVRALLIQLCGPQLELLHLGGFSCGSYPMHPHPSPYFIDAIFLQQISTLSPAISSVALQWPSVFGMHWLQQAIDLFPRARYVRLEDDGVAMTSIRAHAPTTKTTLSSPPHPLLPPSSMDGLAEEWKLQQQAVVASGQWFIVRLRLDTSWRYLEQYEPLCQFLCSPTAVHLKELVAPELKFPSFYVVPHRKGGDGDGAVRTATTSTSASSSTNHKRWACQGLEVLSLQFASYGDGSNYRAGSRPMCREMERRVCAFLVLHCPRLRYLALHHPLRMSRDFEAASGICFLGRLAHLEHLVLYLAAALEGHSSGKDTKRRRHNEDGHYPSAFDLGWMRTKLSPVDGMPKRMEWNLAMCRRVAMKKSGCGHFLAQEGGFDLLCPQEGQSPAEEGALWLDLKSVRFVNKIILDAKDDGAYQLQGVIRERRVVQRVLPQVEIMSIVEYEMKYSP